MSLEKMTLMVDSDLKKEFTECVLKRFPELDAGIIELMKVFVEKEKAAPTQQTIKQKVNSTVYGGDPGSGLNSREIEKIMLNKTDEEIEANRLA